MNNFNTNQNPHILSSPETPEAGTGGINGQTNQAETELSGEVLEGQEGLKSEGQPDVEVGDGYIKFDLENLDTLIANTASNLEVTEKPPYELDPETGLSIQGKQIEDLRT